MDIHEKYITMKKFGSWQLGNQMFQYLFLNYVSKITQRKIIFLYENNDELENYKNLGVVMHIVSLIVLNNGEISEDELKKMC